MPRWHNLVPSQSHEAVWAGNCAALERLFPSGYVGSNPILGVLLKKRAKSKQELNLGFCEPK